MEIGAVLIVHMLGEVCKAKVVELPDNFPDLMMVEFIEGPFDGARYWVKHESV